jgi:hypothetical protein
VCGFAAFLGALFQLVVSLFNWIDLVKEDLGQRFGPMLSAQASRNRTMEGHDNKMAEEAIIDRLAKKYPMWSPLSAEGRTCKTDTGALNPKTYSKEIPVCQCHHMQFKHVTCLEMQLMGMFGVGMGAKTACGKGAVDSQHDWYGGKFASLPKGLPPQVVRGFLFLL